MSWLEELKRRNVAEAEQQRALDLAQAERIGADFGLGELRTTARYRQARSGRIFGTGVFVAVGGVVTGVAFGVADVRYTLAGALAAAGVSAGALLLGVQLMRTGLQLRAVRRLFWYSGGLAQQDLDEPEPRVLSWGEVESVTPGYEYGAETVNGLIDCRLRGRAGTEITVHRAYGHAMVVAVAAEAERMLADRIVAELVRAYGSGEPVAAGQWRIGRSGLGCVGGDGRAALTPWADIRAIEQRRDGEFIIRGPGRRRRTIALSGVPNGVFLARLIEHAAGQHELIRGRGGRTTDRSE